MTSPAADLEARAGRETQRLDAMIADLRAIALAVRDSNLPSDARRRLLKVIDQERVPLGKARDALQRYRMSVRTTRGNNWFTEADG